MKRIKHSIRNLIISIVSLMFVSSVFYHYVESWDWVDSFYFTVLTITTLGHGGILVPTTDGSKIFTSVVAFVGIAMVLTLFGIVSSHYVKVVNNEK